MLGNLGVHHFLVQLYIFWPIWLFFMNSNIPLLVAVVFMDWRRKNLIIIFKKDGFQREGEFPLFDFMRGLATIRWSMIVYLPNGIIPTLQRLQYIFILFIIILPHAIYKTVGLLQVEPNVQYTSLFGSAFCKLLLSIYEFVRQMLTNSLI